MKRLCNNFTQFWVQVRAVDGGKEGGQHEENVLSVSAALDALHHMYGPKVLLGALACTLDGNAETLEEGEVSKRVMGLAVRYPSWRSAFAEARKVTP